VHGRSSTEGDKHDSTPGISPHQSQDRVNRLSPGHLGAYLPTCLPICLPAYLSTHVPARLPIFSPHGVNLQTRHHQHQHQHRHQHQPRGSSPAQPPPSRAGAGKPTGEQRNTNRHGAASSSQCTLSAVLARQENGAMCSSPTPLSYDNKHTDGWGHLHWVSTLDTNGGPAVTRDGLACLLAAPLVPTGDARARRLGWWGRVRRLSEPAAATSCHRVWVHDGWGCHGVA
jgi:hypothetical protein